MISRDSQDPGRQGQTVLSEEAAEAEAAAAGEGPERGPRVPQADTVRVLPWSVKGWKVEVCMLQGRGEGFGWIKEGVLRFCVWIMGSRAGREGESAARRMVAKLPCALMGYLLRAGAVGVGGSGSGSRCQGDGRVCFICGRIVCSVAFVGILNCAGKGGNCV